MRIGVLADTHIRRGSSRTLPGPVYDLLQDVDVILHAGDIVVADVVADLERFAPVHAVLGNNDHELVGELPEARTLTLAGVRVGMIHDSGPAKGRDRRMLRRFPDADLVVFGHSHIPWDTVTPPEIARAVTGTGDGHRQVLFNPGSPTQRRRQPHPTAGILELGDGRIVRRAIVAVDDPVG